MSVENEPDKPEARTAELCFPEWREDIQRLRSSDPIFREICNDLDLVAGMLRDERTSDTAAMECLEGLKDEIRQTLMRETGNP